MVHGSEAIKKLNDEASEAPERPLNRQAKAKGSDDWVDMGSVSFEDAAATFAERQNLVTDKLFVTVRDDQDLTEFDLTVESFRGFRVTGLRGF